MATYTPTGDENLINKTFTGGTTINLQDYIDRYNQIKEDYLRNIAQAKIDAAALYGDLKPIKDAGLLPAKFNTAYNQLEAFIT